MDTKILKIAICAVIFGWGGCLSVQASDEGAAGMMLEKVTTISGKVFTDVELLTADDHGLLFRHSKGTAKVDFEDLQFNLRQMFEPEPRIPAMDAAIEKENAKANENGKGDEPGDLVEVDAANGKGDEPGEFIDEEEEETDESLEIITRTRVYPHRQPQLIYWVQPNWLPQWSRYQSAHAASYFYNRQLIEQDFLISSGLLRPPCGVTVRRLPRRGY